MGRFLPVVLLFACAIAVATARAGEIADAYDKQPAEGKQILSDSLLGFSGKPDLHGVSRIGLERTSCFGFCPAYWVIIESDGSFRYHGEYNTSHQGDWTGKIDSWSFDHIAIYIHDIEFTKLSQAYSVTVTDNPTVYTLAVTNGKQKVVSNYADAGPIKLWALEEMIDHALDKADWTAPPSTQPTTRPVQ